MNNSRILNVFLYEHENASYFDTYFQQLLAGLDDFNFEIHVYLIKISDDRGKFRFRHYVSGRITVHEILTTKNHMFRTFHLLRQIIRSINFCHLTDNSPIIFFRSTVPTLAVIFSLLPLKFRSFRFIYDSDGLAMDEYREFRNNIFFVYWFGRIVEYIALKMSDLVLVRSNKTVEILTKRCTSLKSGQFCVLNNGRDTKKFVPLDRKERLKSRLQMGYSENDIIFVYSGSIGEQYLTDKMIEVFSYLNRLNPDFKLIILTDFRYSAQIQDLITRHSLLPKFVTLVHTSSYETINYLQIADIGFAFRKTSFSMKHVKPLKVREYLLCGLPIISLGDTGDEFDVATKDFIFEYIEDPAAILKWISDEVKTGKARNVLINSKFAIKTFNIDDDVQALTNAIKFLQI